MAEAEARQPAQPPESIERNLRLLAPVGIDGSDQPMNTQHGKASWLLIEQVTREMRPGGPYPDVTTFEFSEGMLLGAVVDATPETRLRSAYAGIRDTLKYIEPMAIEKPPAEKIVDTLKTTQEYLRKPFSVNRKGYTPDWLIEKRALLDAVEAALRMNNDLVLQGYDSIAARYGQPADTDKAEVGEIRRADLLKLKDDLLLSCKQGLIVRVLSTAKQDFRINWAKLDPDL